MLGKIVVRGLIAGVVLFAVEALFHQFVELLLPSVTAEYKKNPIFRPWPGWTQTYMILHPLGFGFLFAYAHMIVCNGSGATGLHGVVGGAAFGLLLAAAGAVPVYLIAFAAVRLPAPIAILWVVQAVMQYVAAGACLGAWIRRPR